MESPGGYGRRPRTLLWIMMAALLVVVLFVVFKVIPQPTEILSDRTANKRLKEARTLEEQSLNLYAAEIYEHIADSARISPDLRLQAARGLARTARATGHMETVEAALEKAVAFSRPGPEQEAMRDELGQLRGHPFAGAATTTTAQSMTQPSPATPPPAQDVNNPYPLPEDARILARIGNERVSEGELLAAWQRFNGYRKTTTEDMTPFIRYYIDLVLLADEACRRGVNRQPDTIYDLRVQRVTGLNQAMTEELVRDLKTPEIPALEAYYQEHKAMFTTPAHATIGHILVSDEGDVGIVRRALGQGQTFAKVAQRYSRDADKLKDGYILGEIAENDPGIPGLGPNPQLVRQMMAMNDGATTGPIQTARGLEFLHIVQKTGGTLRPFSEVQENVLFNYQKQALAAARQSLLAQLRKDRPMEIEDPQLRQAVLAAQESTSATTATVGAAPPAPAALSTTSTLPITETLAMPAPPGENPATTENVPQKSSPKKTVRSSSGKKSGRNR